MKYYEIIRELIDDSEAIHEQYETEFEIQAADATKQNNE